MAEQLIHYQGLKSNQTSWFRNDEGLPVPVFPGARVLLDPALHPEIQPALLAGTAAIEADPPRGIDHLHERSSPSDTLPMYDRYFGTPRTRGRSRGLPEIASLSVEELGKAVRCFTPWPGWQEEVSRSLWFSESRRHQQGAPSRICLPSLFELNFIILHRIAEHIAKHFYADLAEAIEAKVLSCWESGQYDSKRDLRNNIKCRISVPTRRQGIGEVLRLWGAWRGAAGPSARSLRKYRSALGSDCAVRTFADQQIFEVLQEPSQRILLGQGIVEVGSYEPGRAASRALTIIGPTLGCITYCLSPSFEQGLLDSGASLEPFGIRPRPYNFPV